MKNYTTFNRLILFTVEAYISRALEEGLSKEPFHQKIVSGIRGYMTFGRFSKEEAELLQKLGEDPVMQRIKAQEISFVVYALVLLKLWVENVPREARKGIYLGISNKKLLMGHSAFAITMLQMKRQNEEMYKDKKQIINDSVKNASDFFSFFEEKLVNQNGEAA